MSPARPTFATCKRFAARDEPLVLEGNMFTGLLGFAMLVGMAAASYSFYASGSFLLALITYSVAGTCVMLGAMLYVAVRGEAETTRVDDAQVPPIRKAA